MKRLIKEYNSYKRDYPYIKNRILYVFDIIASDEDLEDFEHSDDYNPDMTDEDYVEAYINYDMDNIKENKVNEDGGASGVACAVQGGGMGAVISSQPSSIPGQTTGGGSNAGDAFGNGGVVGSGDIANAGMNRNVRSNDDDEPRSRRKKKLKNALKMKSNKYKIEKDNSLSLIHI